MDGGNHGNTKVQGHFRMSGTAYGSVTVFVLFISPPQVKDKIPCDDYFLMLDKKVHICCIYLFRDNIHTEHQHYFIS